jgi:3D (Asp-Asp-Asp) domain-containing protein
VGWGVDQRFADRGEDLAAIVTMVLVSLALVDREFRRAALALSVAVLVRPRGARAAPAPLTDREPRSGLGAGREAATVRAMRRDRGADHWVVRLGRRALVGLGTAAVVVLAASASRAERSLAPSGASVARAVPCRPGRPPHERLITTRRWLREVAITEYYSSPERWFTGRFVRAPGLAGRHRVDWLYSARGVAMEGDGIGLDGRHYHIDALGAGGWVNAAGRHTRPGRCAGHWSRGRPAWLQGGWRNAAGQVTFPLSRGGWSNGRGRGSLSYGGVTFAPGSSLALHAYRTLAVDRRLIPTGSRVYIPWYRRHHVASGWFVAQDTGGAILGRHVDVYRPPTATPLDGGRYLKGQRIYVIPPGR